jgi:putative DNA primase/helicase
VLPLLDTAGRIHGLQFLRTSAQAAKAKRPAKEFWPAGLIKKGHFHLIGAPQHLVLVAEGYATGASLHEATGYPVAIAFDAGNLAPVVAALRALQAHADPDLRRRRRLRREQRRHQRRQRRGARGRRRLGGAALRRSRRAPRKFEANGHKLTDFNDLHALEGLHVVRTQIEARLSELDWHAPVARPPTTGGEGRGEKLKPIESTSDLLERYSLVYAHSGAVFDRQEHILLSLSDMRDACVRKDIHRGWVEHPARDIVRIREVGFDPTGADPQITCNLYGGWPTVPKCRQVRSLLELLQFMCRADANAATLALGAQVARVPDPASRRQDEDHAGAARAAGHRQEPVLRSADVDLRRIRRRDRPVGRRGQVQRLGQPQALHDRRRSRRAIRRLPHQEQAQGPDHRRPDPHQPEEFRGVLGAQPPQPGVPVERDHAGGARGRRSPARRHLDAAAARAAFYEAVMAEIRDGGVAALHDYLLHLDLGEFSAAAKPPLTAAKTELIGLGLDSPMRFYDDVIADLFRTPVPQQSGSGTGMFRMFRTQPSRARRQAPLSPYATPRASRTGRMRHMRHMRHNAGATRAARVPHPVPHATDAAHARARPFFTFPLSEGKRGGQP